MRLVYVPPLSDAYFFINHARGLPSISSAQNLTNRYLTSCILLSWTAVEVAVSHLAKELHARGALHGVPSRQLIRSVESLLILNNRTLDVQEYRRLRKVRNDVAHPRADGNYDAPQVSVTIETFEFCAKVIQDLYHPTTLVFDLTE
jgi:hypothetical protein